jgi:hypothetical protein
MACSSYQALNASDVVQAIFSSSLVAIGRAEVSPNARDAAIHALNDVEAALLASGVTFAEYMERLRSMPLENATPHKVRWRFSARERALQQLDQTLAELCRMTQCIQPE